MRFSVQFLYILLGSITIFWKKGPVAVTAFSIPVPSIMSTTDSKFVTTVLPRSNKTLHFRKDKRRSRKRVNHKKNGNVSRIQRRSMINRKFNNASVGVVPRALLDEIPKAIACCAYDRSYEGGRQAQALLKRYIQEFLAGNSNATLNNRLFNAVMNAWVKSEHQDAPQKIQNIMKIMQDLRKQHDLLDLAPDVISMSLYCLACAKSRKPIAAQKAQGILGHMERKGLKPNTFTYNAVLLAHVHSNNREKALKVEALIHHMTQRYDSGHSECRPDVCSYQSLIAAWSRTSMYGTPQKAEEVLNFLYDESRQRGKGYLRPNCHCYVAAIHAWSFSQEVQKARHAYEILQHMRQLYEEKPAYIDLKPNVVAYTAVLNACSLPVNDAEQENALQIAQLVMEEMRIYKYDRPNFLTFSAFLQVLSSTLPYCKKRDKLSRDTFEQARDSGQVGYIVLEKLQIASPSTYNDIVKEITQQDDDCNDIVQIPFRWSSNVVRERDPNCRFLRDVRDENIEESNYLKLKEIKKKHGEHSDFIEKRRIEKESSTGHGSQEDSIINWSEKIL